MKNIPDSFPFISSFLGFKFSFISTIFYHFRYIIVNRQHILKLIQTVGNNS